MGYNHTIEMTVVFTAVLLLLVRNVVSQKSEGDSCVVQNTNAVGRCTQPQKCQAAKDDFQLNGIQPTFCEHSFRQVLVCCRDGSSVSQTAGPKDGNTGKVFGATEKITDKRRVSERKCEEYSQTVLQTVMYIPLLPDSGVVSVANCDYPGIELIVGGENANQGEFPHMAAIGWLDYDGGYTFSCGGSLISARFVLTAGHCTRHHRAKDPKPAIVRLGDQNLDPSVNDGANPIEVAIKTLHKHPDYSPPKRNNDIALLELAADVDFENHIRPACLWSRPDFGDHTKAFATGWEAPNEKAQLPAKELKKMSLSLLKNEDCDRLLMKNILWSGFLPSQMCAGKLRGGQDTCIQGGSPLQVASTDNQCVLHVIGVSTLGRNCGQSGQPAVFTRVSSYLDWIESVVWKGE